MGKTRQHVYFTWPDGRFSYQCAGCGACCKGLGIGLDHARGEVDRLTAAYPGLVGFLRKRGATWTAFNPRGGCWFLDPEGLCRVEVEHGRSEKPASCRLFPFNRVFHMGGYTVVDFNSVICPLAIASADGSAHGITHDSVLDEMASIADAGIVGIELPSARPQEEAQRIFAREQTIARVCFEAADACIADAAHGAGDDASSLERVWRAQAKEGSLAQARDRVSRALELLLGEPWEAPDRAMLGRALWLTPSMRFNQLFGPRCYDTRTELLSILPELWLSWLNFLARGATLAERTLDLRQATTVWSEQTPLMYLCARWAEAPTLEAGEYQWPDPAEDPDQVVRRFAQACIDNRRTRASLARVLQPLLEPCTPRERVVLARLIEPLLSRIRFRKARAS